jgi:hypothetical protein
LRHHGEVWGAEKAVNAEREAVDQASFGPDPRAAELLVRGGKIQGHYE